MGAVGTDIPIAPLKRKEKGYVMNKAKTVIMTIVTYPRSCGCVWTRSHDFIFYCDEHATDEDKQHISNDFSWKFGEPVESIEDFDE